MPGNQSTSAVREVKLRPSLPELPFGFNVIGNISSNTGLGVHARRMIKLLVEKKLPVAVLDLDPGLERTGHDRTFTRLEVRAARELPYCINFFVLQPTAFFSVAAQFPEVFVTTNRLNVGLIMWELPVVPRSWSRALKVLDVYAAASDFVGSAFAARLESVPTIAVPCPIEIPSGITASRSRFRLAERGTLFVTAFEPHSDIQRKNPFGAIDAFRRAFGPNDRHQLVIKLNNATLRGASHPAVVKLRHICGSQENIRIIDETLSYNDVLSLYATGDVFVSLHRAEGLGLALMEAMALGKPVIATAWSGNMTFMNHTNSCLVGYDLSPVAGDLAVYRQAYLGREATWANPRIEEAAAWMQMLAGDDGMRASIGARAAEDMARYHQRATGAHFIDELSAIWDQRAFLPPRPARSSLQIAQLWDAANTESISIAGRLKRKLHRAAEQHLLWRFRR